jgi:translation elongation factor EF-Ts
MTMESVYTPDAKEILDLRQQTNAPMLDCRRALVEARGDMEKAIQILMEQSNERWGILDAQAPSRWKPANCETEIYIG